MAISLKDFGSMENSTDKPKSNTAVVTSITANSAKVNNLVLAR